MNPVLLRLIVLTIACSKYALGLSVGCSENNYSNSRNCTFRGVVYDDISMDVTFSNNYRYNSPYYFRFVDSKVIEIPKRIFETFSSVQYLSIPECGVESVNRYTFERASDLLLLNMSTNNLQELKNYVFTGAIQLNHLDLTNNNISTIDEKAFANLNELNTLFLSGNKLKALADNVFSSLVNLKKLSLARNSLEILQNELFVSNILLTMLFAQNNRIVVLEKDLFLNVAELEYLWLRNNSLTSFEFSHLNAKRVNVVGNQLKQIKLSAKIEQLFASNNSISEIVADNFTALRLRTLDLAWNNVTSLEAISKIVSLEVLDVSHNKIGPLNITSFAGLTDLIDLNLEDTKISNLQHGTFSQLSVLKRLDISYNNLNRIDMEIFTSSLQMELMFIEGNRLREINYEEIHKIFPSLAKISIADNNWNCSFLTKMIRNLNSLSIVVGGFKSESLIADKTNVKGIYCSDDKNSVAGWNVTAKHLDKYLDESVPIVDTVEIKQIMQNAIDDIGRYTEQMAAMANKSEEIEGKMYDLTKKLISIENEIYEVKKSILDIKMVQLANATNDTHITSDLKKMMQELNDLTLSKLKHTAEEMEFKIYQQTFKIDKFIEKIDENAGKLLVLSKQVGQTGSSVYANYNPTHQELKSASAAADHAGGSQVIMILILVILVALLAIVLVVLYRNKLNIGSSRGAHYGTSNTLATMMDNDI